MSSHQILFYKKSCVYCKKLFDLLQKSPSLMKSFMIVCVDDKSYRIPTYIKSVPSAIIISPTGESHVYTGTNLFNWVKNRIHSQERSFQGSTQSHPQRGQAQVRAPPTTHEVVEPKEWDSFVMNNLSGTFAFIDEQLNENATDKPGYATLENLNSFRIITPDDDGMKNKGEIKPVQYSADVNVSQQDGRRNPFADAYSQQQQQQSSSQYNPNQYSQQQTNQSFDPNMFRDSNYEGNDSRANSRKAQMDAQMEAFKKSRDMGMPQPLRRM